MVQIHQIRLMNPDKRHYRPFQAFFYTVQPLIKNSFPFKGMKADLSSSAFKIQNIPKKNPARTMSACIRKVGKFLSDPLYSLTKILPKIHFLHWFFQITERFCFKHFPKVRFIGSGIDHQNIRKKFFQFPYGADSVLFFPFQCPYIQYHTARRFPLPG